MITRPPDTSLWHGRPSAGSLLLGAIALAGSAIFVRTPAGLGLLSCLWMSGCVLAQAPLRRAAAALVRVMPLLAVTLAVHVLVSAGFEGGLADIARFHITSAAFAGGLFFTVRLGLIFATGAALLASCPVHAYCRATGRWLSKFPVGRSTFAQVELVVGLALRFVPLLLEERQRLVLALAARGGMPPRRSAFAGRLRTERRLAVPLIVNTMRRADQISMALAARGYDARVIRTSFQPSPVGMAEAALALVFVAACLAAPFL